MWNSNMMRVLLAACAAGLSASILANDQLQVHGFISQTAVNTDANDFGGHSQDGVGLDMREMGLNTSFRPNGDWLFSGQALARWAGATDGGDLRVDYAFVDRTLDSSDGHRLGIQVGKVKNPYGLFNTTRDVAHTRPGILMPQSVYLDRVRDFFLAAPGVSAYGNHAFDAWDVNWRINMVRMETDSKNVESLLLADDRPGHFRGRNSWLAQMITEKDGGRARIGLTLGDVEAEYVPGAGDIFANGSSTLKPRVLSLEWNEEKWSLTGEYSLAKSVGKNYGASALAKALQDPNTVLAWYVQATYRPARAWQVFIRRDEIYLDKDDKNGREFSAKTGGLFPAYVTYAKDWTVGARRDFGNWALSGELHAIKGTVWLSPLDTPISPSNGSPEKHWRMLLLQAAYRF